MKKYLLGLLTIPFSLIAFSSANNLNISCEFDEYGDESCTPTVITLNTNSCEDGIPQLTISSFSCEFDDDEYGDEQLCGISLFSYGGAYVNIGYFDGELSEFDCSIENDNTEFEVHTYAGVGSFNGILTIPGNNSGGDDNTGGGDDNTGGGDDNTGGDSGESGELIGQLTPVVDGLKNSIDEFIPYVVYIGLGVLGVIIGFVAIKWLMNYVKGKSLGTFNSRRRK